MGRIMEDAVTEEESNGRSEEISERRMRSQPDKTKQQDFDDQDDEKRHPEFAMRAK